MTYINKKAAGWGTCAALERNIRGSYSNGYVRKKPIHFEDFKQYPHLNYLIIACEWNALNILRRIGIDFCMLCEESPSVYDFSFCFNQVVWVLYSSDERNARAFDLARTVQLQGAKIVQISKLDLKELGEIFNVRK